jgi:signal recognition particle subunit SRP54
MFDALTDRLQGAMRAIRGDAKITPENIEDAIREVRKSLLEADVSLKVVKIFISRVRQKALGAEVLESISPDQQFIKIVYDELVTILGGENVPLNLKGGPGIVMLLGLQGSGKTTASAKLAARLKKEGFNPLLVACDVQRPAAILQLQSLGKKIDIPVFTLATKDVQEIGEKAVEEANRVGYNPVILDTAGRLQIDTELMAELLLLDRTLQPSEKILVIDAMTGQEAVNVAETFNTQLDVTGLLLSKIDGDARGGAALSVRESVGRPVKYISTGEKMEDLEAFYPDRMASRILGMGDVLSLVEKAQESIDEKEAESVAKRMMKGEFTLAMFMDMQKMMKKMGPMGNGEKMMKLYETAINSMTKMEREHPDRIDMSRRRRIARGSGMKESEIGRMLNEFEQMRQIFSYMHKMGLGGLMGGGGGLPGMGGGFPGFGGGGFPGMGGGGFPGMGGGFPGSSGSPMPPFPPGGLPGATGSGKGSGGGKLPKGFPPLGGPGGGYYGKKKKRH